MSGELQVLDALTPEQEAHRELETAMEVLTRSKVVIVTTDAEYSEADAAVASIKNAQKRAENRRTELVKPLNDVVKKINAGFKPIDTVYEQALGCYRKPMSAYQAKLAMERAKAEEEARKERERIAQEEARKVEEARRIAVEAEQAAQSTDDPFDALLANEEAEEANRKAALQMEESKQAIREVATLPVNAPAKVTGSASKTFEVWHHEITNPELVPLKYRPIDETAIARDVRIWKGDCQISGVRVYKTIEVK